MILTIDHHGSSNSTEFGSHRLDLGDMLLNALVTDVDTLEAYMFRRISTFALHEGVSPRAFFPLYLYDQEQWEELNNSKRVDAGPDNELNWIREVAQVAWFIHENTHEHDKVFALLDDSHWQYIDFDNLEDELNENLVCVDNLEEYVQEYYSEVYSIESAIEPYIDWERVADDFRSDLTEREWDGTTFYYHQ